MIRSAARRPGVRPLALSQGASIALQAGFFYDGLMVGLARLQRQNKRVRGKPRSRVATQDPTAERSSPPRRFVRAGLISPSLVLLLALPLLIPATGCATLMTGLSQKIEVVSSPPGATVKTDLGQQTQTPGTLRVEKLAHHQLTFSKPGYLPVTLQLPRRVQWYVMGNIVFLILPGMLVDFLGGGAFALPKKMGVRLTPDPRASQPADTESEGVPQTTFEVRP